MDFLNHTLGMWVNVAAIIAGTTVGVVLGGKLSDDMNRTLMQALSLVAAYVSMGMAQALGKVSVGIFPGVILGLMCITLGAVLGEAWKWDEKLNILGDRLKRRFNGSGRFTEGFVSSSLLFSIGPMTIVGALQSSLQQNHDTLFLKAALDGMTSIALTGAYGVGVGFSALAVFVVQGLIILLSGLFASSIPNPSDNPMILLITGVGGLMILAVPINLLLASFGRSERIKTGSFLPALMLAPVLYLLVSLLIMPKL